MRHPPIQALRRFQRNIPDSSVLAPVEDHQQRVFQPADVDLLYDANLRVDLREREVALFQLRNFAFLSMSPLHQSLIPVAQDFQKSGKLRVLRFLFLIRRFVMSSCDSVVIAQIVAS